LGTPALAPPTHCKVPERRLVETKALTAALALLSYVIQQLRHLVFPPDDSYVAWMRCIESEKQVKERWSWLCFTLPGKI